MVLCDNQLTCHCFNSTQYLLPFCLSGLQYKNIWCPNAVFFFQSYICRFLPVWWCLCCPDISHLGLYGILVTQWIFSSTLFLLFCHLCWSILPSLSSLHSPFVYLNHCRLRHYLMWKLIWYSFLSCYEFQMIQLPTFLIPQHHLLWIIMYFDFSFEVTK